jgi:DNA-binding winged helix-turn-helix (wHTH) protein/tetratricopeptide (TPR) repeat protein
VQFDRYPGQIALFSDYCFDPLRLELRKASRHIRLETKPAQILILLLERPGELVTREEMRSKLWPNNVHLDFEHGLNKCICKLRSALSDNHAEPRFIETISRRGYRFHAPVQFLPSPVSASRVDAGSGSGQGSLAVRPSPVIPIKQHPPDGESVQTLRKASVLPSASHQSPTKNQPFSQQAAVAATAGLTSLRRYALFAVATFAVAVVFAITTGSPTSFWHAFGHKPRRSSVVVLDLRNLSNDPQEAWLATAFTEWLSVELSSGEQLRLVSAQDSTRAAAQLGLVGSGSLSPQSLAKLGKLLDADLVLSGSYAVASSSSADHIRLDVVLQSTTSGETLTTCSFLGDRAHVFALAAEAGLGLRGALHLPEPSPLGLGGIRAALPVDPEAARYYSEALQHLRSFDDRTALEFFAKAEKIEPLHAMTHFGLASSYSALGQLVQAREEAKKALELSGSLPREQLLIIRGEYHEAVQDWNSAAEDYAALFRFFPDQIDYGLRLTSVQIASSRLPAALDTLKSLRLLPSPLRDDPRIDLMEAAAAAGRSDFRLQRQASSTAAAKGAQQGSALLVARAQVSEGEALRSLGQFQPALDLWQSAQKAFAAEGDLSGVAQALTHEAFVLWKMDRGAQAENYYKQSIAISRSAGDQGTLAGALLGLANIVLYQDQPVRTREYLDEAIWIYHTTGNTKEEAYALSLLADFEMVGHNLVRAKELYQHSLLLSRQTGDESRVAGRLMDLGIVDTWQGSLASAAEELNESVKIYRALGEKNRLSYALHRLARVHIYQDHLPEAKRLLEEAISLSAEVGDKSTIWQPRTDLAWVLLELGQPVESEQVAWLSLREHSFDSEVFSWTRIAFAQCAQSKISDCRASYLHAVHFPAHLRCGEFEVNLDLLHAQLLSAEGSLHEARQEFKNATRVADRSGMLTERLKVRVTLGDFLIRTGQDSKARQFLESARQESRQKGFELFALHAQTALVSRSSVDKLASLPSPLLAN